MATKAERTKKFSDVKIGRWMDAKIAEEIRANSTEKGLWEFGWVRGSVKARLVTKL
jgi:hypothetical protein